MKLEHERDQYKYEVIPKVQIKKVKNFLVEFPKCWFFEMLFYSMTVVCNFSFV